MTKAVTRTLRTLVFCTAHVGPDTPAQGGWAARYRRWVDAVQCGGLLHDQALIVDDGSPALPDWPDLAIIDEPALARSRAPLVLHHFPDRLGRRGVSDFPGWVRSFFFAARYAEAHGFERVVHLESDAFLLSRRIVAWCNGFDDGWAALWCPRYGRPETGIQVIAGAGLETWRRFAAQPVEALAGRVIETTLPFTQIERRFVGDRYTDAAEPVAVPRNADWCMQAECPPGVAPLDFYWWLPLPAVGDARAAASGLASSLRVPAPPLRHSGFDFLRLLAAVDQAAAPQGFVAISTKSGRAARCIACHGVLVDPAMASSEAALQPGQHLAFLRSDAAQAFAEAPLSDAFPHGVDLALLDGLHAFATMLDDFMAVEAASHPGTVVLLHDCLPLNHRMTGEPAGHDPSDDDPALRDFWTGDVWKIIPTLQHYRPDLSLAFVNCGPTGFVVCRGLKARSTVLRDARAAILARVGPLSLTSYGLGRLWSSAPTLDAATLAQSPAGLRALFAFR